MKIFLCAFVLFCLTAGSLDAQESYWENAPGPYGGYLLYIYPTNGSFMYARYLDNSIYRSTDYGVNWTLFQIPSTQTGAEHEELEIGLSGNFYSIATEGIGSNATKRLYCSTDEGASWHLKNPQVSVLGVRETPAGTLLGFDTSNNMYRSSDTGATWQLCFDEFQVTTPSTSNFIFANDGKIVFVTYQGPIYYSLDDGQTWALGGNEIFNIQVRPRLMPSGTLFKMHMDGDPLKFYRSNDWGTTWLACGVEFEDAEHPTSVAPLTSGRLLMTTNRHLYYSDDDGITWSILSTAQKPDFLYWTYSLQGNILLGNYKGAVFRSFNGGNNWDFSAYGIGLASTQQLLFLSDSLQLAQTATGLWHTADAGNIWSLLLPDTSTSTPATYPIAAINPDSFAVVINQRILRTTDAGQTFGDITPPHFLNDGVFKTRNRFLFTNDSSGILRSVDFGLSWQTSLPGELLIQLEQHPNGVLFARTFTIEPFSNGILRFRKSEDNGNTWQELLVPNLLNISDIVISNSGVVYAVAQHRMAYSSNLGSDWTITKISDEAPLSSNISVNEPGHIFVNGNQVIWTSVDGGLSWYTLPTCPTNVTLLNGLEISPSGQLYVIIKSRSIIRTRQSTEIGGYINGRVIRDSDADCSTPDAQEPLKGWIVTARGEQDFFINTSDSGKYAAYLTPGLYNIDIKLPQNTWWLACNSTSSVQIGSGDTLDSLDFSVKALSECPLMSVDIAAPLLRRCFNNPIYVSYCNSGSEAADNAWVDVELDPYMSFVDSEQPHTPLGNNTYRFQLGDVDWSDCGQFSLTVHVDCDSTVLGQTHCISAHAFPDTLCNPVLNWSGATIEANATCQDSVVQLQLRNTTPVPSATLNYIIIEDDVVLFQGQRQYDGNEIFNLEYPANGHTWRVESQQEPGHPFSNVALAFLEGCGGYQTLGYVNQFSVNGWTPSVNQECVENTGSFDPNDKRGFPLGFGDAHRIRPGQALQYMIRFQNTGTDTAFTVQIRDTLSQWLDPGTIRPGASSHPYTWTLSGPGVLTFRFDHIMLPDSNTNLAGSQGFVSFWIDQRPEVPLETQILNSAAIYFDFNTPVMTNQTLHTVGIDYITSVKDFEKQNLPAIGVQPNPAATETLLTLPTGTERLILMDIMGRPVRFINTRAGVVRLERGDMPAGMYGLRAENRKGNVVGVGKVVWR